jgi:hypothetical protein
MTHRYIDLKFQLEIVDCPFLGAFERYCEDMKANTRVLEWSCKLRRGKPECRRFLHTAREPDYAKAKLAVERLFAFLECSNKGHIGETFFAQLPRLAERVGQGVALGYAEDHRVENCGSELKLYIATSRVAEVRHVIEEMLSGRGVCPPSTRRVMIAASINEDFECSSRVYYLWDRTQLTQPDVEEWLRTWCTQEEIELISTSGSATTSIAFKKSERDMLYLSAPYASEHLNRYVLRRLGDHPLMLEHLNELRWVGFSKHREGLDCDELNVYFSSVL